MNALLAWVLAFGLCALGTVISGYAILSNFNELPGSLESRPEVFWSIWGFFGLIAAGFVLRPVENFIRRVGYGLNSVEEQTELADGDTISETAENALADRIAEELRRD